MQQVREWEYKIKTMDDINTPWENLEAVTFTGTQAALEAHVNEIMSKRGDYEARYNRAGRQEGHYLHGKKWEYHAGLAKKKFRVNPLYQLAGPQHSEALERYNTAFDGETYRRVTQAMDKDTANRFIDTCMALCGDPYHAVDLETDWGEWGEDALAYLGRFSPFDSLADFVEE
jgi:hypothetical protein